MTAAAVPASDDAPFWTPTEALTWLAFGKPQTWDEWNRWDLDFIRRWRTHPPATDVLRLLEARAAPCPSYPWHPVIRDRSPPGEPVVVVGWASSFASPPRTVRGLDGFQRVPGAPELARAIRADYRRKLGRLVSYGELVALLRANLAEDRERDAELDAANRALRKAIGTGQVTALGVPASSLNQLPQPLPRVIASWPIQFRHDGIEPSQEATPADRFAMQSSARFVRVRFDAAEIRALRQPIHGGANATNAGMAAPTQARRRHTGLDYRQCDAPLVQQMKVMLDTGKAHSRTDAARAVENQAAGRGKSDGKVARLVKLFGKTYRDA